MEEQVYTVFWCLWGGADHVNVTTTQNERCMIKTKGSSMNISIFTHD